MPPRYPAPLPLGARIARIAGTAPSSGVLPALHRYLDLVLGHPRGDMPSFIQ